MDVGDAVGDTCGDICRQHQIIWIENLIKMWLHNENNYFEARHSIFWQIKDLEKS